MINLSFNDDTQAEIIPELVKTERLITYAIQKETGHEAYAEITAMPDLGFANNAIRMRGGFFTGMFARWKCQLPFVPVDATVNSCGVAVYMLRDNITKKQFANYVSLAKKKIGETNYHWNFERGNHFISLCSFPNGRQCVVMHASADEYKRGMDGKSLYPEPGVWYYDKIRTVFDPDSSGRYLRYLAGAAAEQFIGTAVNLESVNHTRMNDIAALAFGGLLEDELLFVPHYGMPTHSSIAIGCAWENHKSILLSRPDEDLYIIKPNHEQPVWLTPHGFGSCVPSPRVDYRDGYLYVNDIKIQTDEDVCKLSGKDIRAHTGEDCSSHVDHILSVCDGVVDTRIHQIYSLNSRQTL